MCYVLPRPGVQYYSVVEIEGVATFQKTYFYRFHVISVTPMQGRIRVHVGIGFPLSLELANQQKRKTSDGMLTMYPKGEIFSRLLLHRRSSVWL